MAEKGESDSGSESVIYNVGAYDEVDVAPTNVEIVVQGSDDICSPIHVFSPLSRGEQRFTFDPKLPLKASSGRPTSPGGYLRIGIDRVSQSEGGYRDREVQEGPPPSPPAHTPAPLSPPPPSVAPGAARAAPAIHPKRIHVTVISASGLRNADASTFFGGLSDPFVIVGMDKGTLKGVTHTKVIDNQLDPVWNEDLLLDGYIPGQALIFSVKDKDELPGAAEALGVATLPSADFFPNGTQGVRELPLTDAKGKGHPTAHLKVKVKILDAGSAVTAGKSKLQAGKDRMQASAQFYNQIMGCRASLKQCHELVMSAEEHWQECGRPSTSTIKRAGVMAPASRIPGTVGAPQPVPKGRKPPPVADIALVTAAVGVGVVAAGGTLGTNSTALTRIPSQAISASFGDDSFPVASSVLDAADAGAKTASRAYGTGGMFFA